MKTGNYLGWCDRGYKRYSPLNGDRLIDHGLVTCGSTPLLPVGNAPSIVTVDEDPGLSDLPTTYATSTGYDV